MHANCQHIDHALKLAEAEGNVILIVSKSELMDQVIWMKNQLSPQLRKKIQLTFKDLLYEKTEAKPHDPASEYFVCNECKVALVFPLEWTMETTAMKNNLEKLTSLCEIMKEKKAVTDNINEIEKELLAILNFIKTHELFKKGIQYFLINILKGIENYPLEIVMFCMRDLRWTEVKDAALDEKNNTNNKQIIERMNRILEVYETDWEDADMYEYYSKK